MYLHKLEKDEKTTFLTLATHLAKADDNEIDQKEQFTLQYMAAEMGLDIEDFAPQEYDAEKTALVFHRDIARRVLALEAIGVCRCNGDIAAAQRAVLVDLAGRLSLPSDFIARAEAVIEKQLAVMDEFDSLVESG